MHEVRHIIALIATMAILAVALGIVMTVLRHRRQIRELLSRERLAALEKGKEIPWELDAARPRRVSRQALGTGFLLGGMGLGLVIASAFAGMDMEDMVPLGVFLLVTGLALVAYDGLVARHEWRRATELDEELTRAYIRRLEGSAGSAREASAEKADSIR